ncbi:hypothetical protein PSQ20_21805 [Curvibacter sp. RS43]|uniref:hypothetical protein n=1 Tax=Curvibacter microcysteis TaxID=3026419 RepID=UPI0023608617|nr:hypothetical protein [Curvibacter sp. RS43]MDD0812986.1 hypothetical protein [Curvibacter sp. RS43]
MKYENELNRPVVRRRIGLLSDPQVEAERISNEVFSKFPALFEAHGVEAGDWMTLAFELAKAHVPGFKVIDAPGRPIEWSDVDRADFRIDVDAVIAYEGLSIAEAIKQAIRQPRWAEKTSPMTMAALRQQYKTADKRWIEVVKKARAWEKMGSDK